VTFSNFQKLPDLFRSSFVCDDSRSTSEAVHTCVAEKFWLLSPETSDDEGRLRRLIKRSLVLCAFSPWWSQKVTGCPRGGSKNHDRRAQDILISTGFIAAWSFLYPLPWRRTIFALFFNHPVRISAMKVTLANTIGATFLCVSVSCM
jgi:hypothetical protein